MVFTNWDCKRERDDYPSECVKHVFKSDPPEGLEVLQPLCQLPVVTGHPDERGSCLQICPFILVLDLSHSLFKGSGKTFVAVMICEHHFQNMPTGRKAKVVFLATKVPVYQQQKNVFKQHFERSG